MSVRTAATTEEDLEQLTELFRLLSDKTRLNILLLLSDGERNVTSLCEQLQLPQPTVSHHLGLMRMHNVIVNRRAGKQIFYALRARIHREPGSRLQIGMEKHCIHIDVAPPSADNDQEAAGDSAGSASPAVHA